MARLSVRITTREDIPLLTRLGVDTYRETFVEDFGIQYPPQDEARFIEEAYGAEALLRYFEDPEYQHLIGELDGVPLGYALVGRNTLPHPDAKQGDGEFKRLYVKRQAQTQGLGLLLFEVGMKWLEQHFSGPLWLGVWEHNERAKKFYLRNGFKPVGEYVFRVGETEETDWILRKDKA